MHKARKSASLILVAMILVGLLGTLGLVVDKGRLYYYRWKLTNTCQAATMASIYDLPDVVKSRESFDKALEANNFSNNTNGRSIVYNQVGNKVQAVGTHQISLTFARLLGYDYWTVSTQVTARSGPIASLKKVAPIGVLLDGDTLEFAPTRYRLENIIHYSSGSNENLGYNIKYYPLSNFGGLQNTIVNRYSGDMKINHTPTVYSSGDTFSQLKNAFETIDNSPNTLGAYNHNVDNFNIDSTPRLMKVPIVQEYTANPHKVIIRGFALFYIEQVHVFTDANGNEIVSLVGFFLKNTMEGPIIDSPVNYGIVGSEIESIQ